MSFNNVIDILTKEITKFNNSLFDSDGNILVDKLTSDKINVLMENYKSYATTAIDDFNKLATKNEEKKRKTVDFYNARLIDIKNNFLNTLKQITEIKKFNISSLKSSLEENMLSLDKEFKDNLTIINANTSKTNQVIYSHLIKHDQEIAKNNFQLDEANALYNNIINQFNQEASLKKNTLRSSISRQNYNYEDAYKGIIDNISAMTNDNLILVKKFKEELNDKQSKIHEAIITQSTLLNEKINILSMQAQKEINNCKIQLDIEIQQINKEIDAIKEKHSEHDREVLKIFAVDLTKIDEDYDSLTKKYNIDKEVLIRAYHYLNFDLEKKVNNLNQDFNKEIVAANAKADTIKARRLIKERNISLKCAMKSINELKMKHFYDVHIIDEKYQASSNQFKTEKYLAEINKNHHIKQINVEKNYYLSLCHKRIEKANYQTNLLIDIINKQLNVKISELILRNDIRVLGLNKDLNKAELYISHEIDELQQAINNFMVETNFNNKLHSLVTTKDKTLGTKKLNLIDLLGLLHIETNKILQTYNKNCAFINSKLYDTKYNYLEKESFINRDYYKDTLKNENERLSNEKNYLIKLTSLNIKQEQSDESFIRSKNKLHYIKSIGIEKYNLYVKRHRFEKLAILKAFTVFINMLKSADNLLVETLTIIYNTIFKDGSNISYGNYYNHMIILITNHKNQIADAFTNIVVHLIEDRIDFETGFKYNSLLADIDEQLDSQKTKFEDKSKSLKDTINNYQATCNNYIKKKIGLENEQLILTRDYNSSKITKDFYLHDKKELIIQIQDLDVKIDRNERLIDLLNEDLKKLPKSQLKLEKTSRKRKFKVSARLKKESYVYYLTMDLIKNQTEDLKKYNEHSNKILLMANVSDKDLNNHVSRFNRYKESFYEGYIRCYNRILKNVSTKITKEHTKLKGNYIKHETKDRYKILVSNNLEKEKINHDISLENKQYQSYLHHYQVQTKSLIKNKRSDILSNKKTYNYLVNDINGLKNNFYLEFYNNSHSMFDNIRYITMDNLAAEAKGLEDYNRDFKALVRDSKLSKRRNTLAFEQSTIRFNTNLTDLPSLLKMQARELSTNQKLEKKRTFNYIKNAKANEKNYLNDFEDDLLNLKFKMYREKLNDDKQRKTDISSVSKHIKHKKYNYPLK